MDEEKRVESRENGQADETCPPLKVVIPATGALYLAVFLVALDRTILGTAIPAISNDFQSFGDISWYEAGFLLPLCVFQLSFGRVYTYYSTKWVLIALVAIFEIGSIVSATAPTSKALIAGRVVTGIGGAGTTSGALVLINNLVPLRSRPAISGGLGAVFGLASVIGPLAGGFLTAVTWRWCFWINVPIGGIALIALLFAAPNNPPPSKPANTALGKIDQLDPVGFALVGPAAICLILATQWGGVQYPWNDGRIIALFVLCGIFGAAFVMAQIWRKEKATVPSKVFLQRSILAGVFLSIGNGSLIVVNSFYLPIWFQAIKGQSPQGSGISLLALLLSTVVFVMISGIGATVLGYYTPFAIIGGAILIVGSALLTTWEVDTSSGIWIGYQIIVGAGQGLVLQQANIAAQTVLPNDEVAIGVSVIAFAQFLGGSVFVAVCQSLLENKLASGLAGKIQGFDPSTIANQGATSLRDTVSADELPLVLNVYNDALRDIRYVALALAVLIFISSLGFEWKSVKKEKDKSTSEKA